MKPDVSTNVYGRLDRIEENGRETREAVVELRAVMLGANGEGGHLQHQRDMNKLLMAATKQNAGGVERNRRGIARLWGIGVGAGLVVAAVQGGLEWLRRM